MVAADEGDALVFGEFADEGDELQAVGEVVALDERVELVDELGGFERLALAGDLKLEDEDGLLGRLAVLVGEPLRVLVLAVVELGCALAPAAAHGQPRLPHARIGALALVVGLRVEEAERLPVRAHAGEGRRGQLEGLGELLRVGAALEAYLAAPLVVVLDAYEVDEEVGLLELVSIVGDV